jgi:hypothetical protein
MTINYFSPAFSPRPPEDIVFLRNVDGATSFSLFWIDVVRPLLQVAKAKRLLQVGAYMGEHTRLLLDYCDSAGGSLVVVEPFVTPELEGIVADNGRCRLIVGKSHDVFPQIQNSIDVVFLNGDLNYHTVRGDLADIDEMAKRTGQPFPVVVMKSMSWPYARRDMYYDPEAIPADARHDYKKMGMTLWSSALEERAINAQFFNASQEGGTCNGVLTAVEDFLKLYPASLKLFTLPINNGLGIIYWPDSATADFIDTTISPPIGLRCLLETCEIARLNDIVKSLRPAWEKADVYRFPMAETLFRIIRKLLVKRR